MSEHEDLTVDQALELLRQHHAEGGDFGTDAALTILRAMNLISELRSEVANLTEELSQTKKEVTDAEDRERLLRKQLADQQSFADLAESGGTVDAMEAAEAEQTVALEGIKAWECLYEREKQRAQRAEADSKHLREILQDAQEWLIHGPDDLPRDRRSTFWKRLRKALAAPRP